MMEAKYKRMSNNWWPVWLNDLVFVYKLSGCGFESRWCHLVQLCFKDIKWKLHKEMMADFDKRLVRVNNWED